MSDLDDLTLQFETELEKIEDPQALEQLRVRYLGKKGLVTARFKELGKLSQHERPARGAELNLLKERVQEGIARRQNEIQSVRLANPTLDLTLPGRRSQVGRIHPLIQTEERVKSIFRSMGFTVETGPEIETTYYNFTALNTPEWHPARDDADTFYVDDDRLLRTETSPVQIRVLERGKLPVRMIAPGRVYRKDKPDPTHFPVFHQVEGLYVDKGVTFSRGGCFLLSLRRRRMPTLQGYGMAGDGRIRDGRSQRSRRSWCRSGNLDRVRLRAGHRTDRPDLVRS
jgi:phenylalanyl-tRNA synthetase alpha chain